MCSQNTWPTDCSLVGWRSLAPWWCWNARQGSIWGLDIEHCAALPTGHGKVHRTQRHAKVRSDPLYPLNIKHQWHWSVKHGWNQCAYSTYIFIDEIQSCSSVKHTPDLYHIQSNFIYTAHCKRETPHSVLHVLIITIQILLTCVWTRLPLCLSLWVLDPSVCLTVCLSGCLTVWLSVLLFLFWFVLGTVSLEVCQRMRANTHAQRNSPQRLTHEDGAILLCWFIS